MSNEYDLIIIGAGPGGYVPAERAGHRGLKTLMIEKSHLGGCCLNVGCIPSKTLLNSAKMYHHTVGGKAYGVIAENVSFDLAPAMKRKDKVIKQLRKGVEYQMKRHHIDVVNGTATFVDRNTVEVDGTRYTGKNIMISTGSSPVRPPIPGADQAHVLTSDEIFDIEALPEKMVIVGGGVIGMEFACFFSNVGVDVTVIEMLDEILPPYDPELAVALRKSLKQVTYQLGCKVEAIGASDVTFSTKDGEKTTIPADMVLLSVGRSPNVNGLGLEAIGVDFNRSGIKVNDKLETNVPGIYAVGDVNGKSLLAHSASRMGEVVVNNLTGRPDHMRYNAIPYVVYTFPDVAACGMTAAQAEEKGHKIEVAKLPMQASGRHLAEHNRPEGFVKVVVDADTRVLLGVHMVGTYASEIIHSVCVMIEDEFRVEDIRDVVFPHPTVAEIVREAVWELPF